jgi:dTDP-4-dehydrorhamnose 3,5-epimerase
MIFRETNLQGAFVIEPERIEDQRGFFARTWSGDEFERHSLDTRLSQCSISFNSRKGTLRGLHYQMAPHEEIKLVRCTMGAIYDVIVDLRPASPSFMQWFAIELTAENRRMLYIPHGLAHGYQTLIDSSEVFYQISEPYHPQSARGVRWDDPAFGIVWPTVDQRVMATRDQQYPDFSQ